MIALMQLLIKYAFLQPFGAQTTLNTFQTIILILASVSIAAAGNVINDIYDIKTDLINKPNKVVIGKSISEKTAYNLFIILNLIGVGLGFYLCFLIGKNTFFSVFIIISILLYIYTTYLKQTFLIGNIVIALLVALSILIVGVFELLPTITIDNKQIQLMYFTTIKDYALMAFIITFIREIAKDIEDIDGDYASGMRTLPIVIGRKRASYVLFTLTLLPLFIITYYTVHSLYKTPIAANYFLIFIIAPLLYVSIKTFNANTKKEYKHISSTLKLIMFFGMLSLLLYKYIFLP